MWRWRIKFFASVCLFAFMLGLMLGTLLKPDQAGQAQLLSVAAEGAELQLCFSQLPKAAVSNQDGAFVMLLAVAPVDAQEGTLVLAAGQTVSWRLAPRSDGMQLGVVGLEPVQGQWSQEPGSACIRIAVQAR